MGQTQGAPGCMGEALAGLCGGVGDGISESVTADENRFETAPGARLALDARVLLREGRALAYGSMRRECAAAVPGRVERLEAQGGKLLDAQAEYVAFLANLEEIHGFLQEMETSPDRVTLSLANLSRLTALNKRLREINRRDAALDKTDALGSVMSGLPKQLDRALGQGAASRPEYTDIFVCLLCGAYHRLLSDYQTLAHAARNLKRAHDSYAAAVQTAHKSLMPEDVVRFATEVEYCAFARVSLQHPPRANALFYAALTTAVDAHAAAEANGSPENADARRSLARYMALLCDANLDGLFDCHPRLLWKAKLSKVETTAARAAAGAALRAAGYKWALKDKDADGHVRRVSGVDPATLLATSAKLSDEDPEEPIEASVGSFNNATTVDVTASPAKESPTVYISATRRPSAMTDLTL